MIPFELEIYITLLNKSLEEESERAKEL